MSSSSFPLVLVGTQLGASTGAISTWGAQNDTTKNHPTRQALISTGMTGDQADA